MKLIKTNHFIENLNSKRFSLFLLVTIIILQPMIVFAGQSQGSWKFTNDGGIKPIKDDSLHHDKETGKDKSVGGMNEFKKEGSAGFELKKKKPGNVKKG